VFEPGRVARHAAGGRAAVEGLGRLVEVDRDRDELRATLDTVRAAGGDEEVDEDVLPRLVDEHEPAGAESG